MVFENLYISLRWVTPTKKEAVKTKVFTAFFVIKCFKFCVLCIMHFYDPILRYSALFCFAHNIHRIDGLFVQRGFKMEMGRSRALNRNGAERADFSAL